MGRYGPTLLASTRMRLNYVIEGTRERILRQHCAVHRASCSLYNLAQDVHLGLHSNHASNYAIVFFEKQPVFLEILTLAPFSLFER
ncbi:hypothetical protein PsorP6_000096 [Peronosclerospora sorghi]|uniref:Uncharacterized protein n=1 Tax=Peronosclerospora sorghi TaxID=230839 RepID=A0ACC0WX55_9STRA|nr:hypothetical protein PsorP6_000096 [Peronosclerospora sorghi]